ncbi:kinetochore protein NDC80 -like, partial [Asbolus verrucosus]
NLTTPASSRSASKSPCRFGSVKAERHVNDKKWVSEQYAKVRRYLQEHTNCQDHIPDAIRPPTINTFVYVMDLLLKEIDSRVDMTVANYKDVVLNRLKVLHYPGSVSNSLLKTVNTMHAWPQVMSIFAWLIDFIAFIRRARVPSQPLFEPDIDHQKIKVLFVFGVCKTFHNLFQYVINYVFERYKLYNNNEDQTAADMAFKEEFEKILNIDPEEADRLKHEIDDLSQLKEQQLDQLKEINKDNDLLNSQVSHMESETDSLYAEDEEKQKDVDEELRYLNERIIRKRQEIKEKEENTAKLNEAVTTQPYTYEEKIEMQKQIDEIQHTLDLEKERVAVKRQIETDADAKLAEARQRVETEIYRLNNEVMRLALVEPELNILRLRETDFTSQDFYDEVRRVVENKKIAEKKIGEELEALGAYIAQSTSENEGRKQRLEGLNETIERLTEEENKTDEQIRKLDNEMENEIRTSIFDHCVGLLHDVHAEEGNILGDLQKLSSIGSSASSQEENFR